MVFFNDAEVKKVVMLAQPPEEEYNFDMCAGVVVIAAHDPGPIYNRDIPGRMRVFMELIVMYKSFQMAIHDVVLHKILPNIIVS